jgi:hypothetical protein
LVKADLRARSNHITFHKGSIMFYYGSIMFYNGSIMFYNGSTCAPDPPRATVSTRLKKFDRRVGCGASPAAMADLRRLSFFRQLTHRRSSPVSTMDTVVL